MSYSISKHEGENLGANHQILWTFAKDVIKITKSKTSLLHVISLKSGKAWNYLYTSPESLKVETNQKPTPAGIKYIYTIKGLIPKDRSNVEVILFKILNQGLILKVQDKNGTIRVFGLIDNPMKMTYKLVKPKDYEGFNGWEVTFKGEFISPAGYSHKQHIPIGSEPGGGPAVE